MLQCLDESSSTRLRGTVLILFIEMREHRPLLLVEEQQDKNKMWKFSNGELVQHGKGFKNTRLVSTKQAMNIHSIVF